MTFRRGAGVALLALGLLGPTGCQSRDPAAAVLEERTRHKVEVTSWSKRDDGKLVVTVRVSGPVHSKLDVLTVEVRALDDGDAVLLSEWVTVDLTDMVRGTPTEKIVVVEAGDVDPSGLAVVMHAEPDAEVLPRLEELEGLR